MASISDSNLRVQLAKMTIDTAALVAEVMVHFLSHFHLNQETVCYLKSKMEEIMNDPTKKSIIADKFVRLIAIAGSTISQEDAMRANMNQEIEGMVIQFYASVTDLENVLTFLDDTMNLELTETNRLKYDRDLGFVLYRMELIKKKVRKLQNDHEEETKIVISDLRDTMRVLLKIQENSLSDNAGESVGAEQNNVSRIKMILNFVIHLARKILGRKVVNLVILLFSKMRKSLENILLNTMMNWILNIFLGTTMMKKLMNLAESKMKHKKQ